MPAGVRHAKGRFRETDLGGAAAPWRMERGRKRDNLDNSGQLLQGAPPQPGGGCETDGKAGGCWGRGRPAREAAGKRKTSGNTNVFCNLAPLLGGATSKSRPRGWRMGGERKGPAERRRRTGRESRRTMATIHDQSCWRQLGQLATTLPRCRADNPARRKKVKNNRGGWSAGGWSTLKTMKTTSRTWKSGRVADGI